MKRGTFLGRRDLIMHLNLNRITLITFSSEFNLTFVDYQEFTQLASMSGYWLCQHSETLRLG